MRRRKPERGYALLALIFALMIIAIWATAAVPSVRQQAQREREIEAYYRGQQIAEAIARFYAGGKLPLQGLAINLASPPKYGWLLDLKKLRDGVTILNKEVHFARNSALFDPLTNGEWEPVRIGDPRIRKFLLAWSKATERPIPPLYMQFVGAQRIELRDTNEDGSPIKPPNGQGFPGGTGDGSIDPNADDEEDDEDFDDEEFEDDEDFEDEEEDDGDDGDPGEDGAMLLSPKDSPFVVISYQEPSEETPGTETPSTNANVNSNTSSARPANPFARSPFGRRLSNAPIIGVVSKSKATAVKTRFGLEKHNEILFIYMPNLPVGPQQLAPQQGVVDANGDGLDDRLDQQGPQSGPTKPNQ
jgi:type II secretory pathway pseudopilin PulG